MKATKDVASATENWTNMIFKGKYIILENNSLEYPVLIPDSFITHKHVGIPLVERHDDKVVSAGFFEISPRVQEAGDGIDLQVIVWGRSISLEVASRPEIDAALIKKLFNKANSLT
jgi:hypothetical protein